MQDQLIFNDGGTLTTDTNSYQEVLSKDTMKNYIDAIGLSTGSGRFYSQIQTFFSGLDRFRHNTLAPNVENVGITLMTRPRLCFADGAVRHQPEFAPLDTLDTENVNFATRALLDTRFSLDKKELVEQCPLIDPVNPFFVPLCNAISGVSGLPDPVMNVFTTPAGFHSEDQTFAIGYDQLSKSYDISLSFKDIQGVFK